MTFIQLIRYRTDQPDAVDKVLTQWIDATGGQCLATRTRVCGEIGQSDSFVEILEFPSATDALTNSNLPATQTTHEAFIPLCTEGPYFTDLEVVRDETL